MQGLVKKLIKQARKQGKLNHLSETANLPIPAVNKVELYLSFHGNAHCDHCITCSGPNRKEILTPANAATVIDHIAAHSILNKLEAIFQGGAYQSERSAQCKAMDDMPVPPAKLSLELATAYADCLLGKGDSSQWIREGQATPLCFGRPAIRISGGEFYTWPHHLDGRSLSEEERLAHQKALLARIRRRLPEYDIYILTNGRFAADLENTRRIIAAWSDHGKSAEGRTRLCISVDVFHAPPAGITIEAMLDNIWQGCLDARLGAPFLYGIPNFRIGLLGRALTRFACCPTRTIAPDTISVYQKRQSPFMPNTPITLDPVDLVASGGCNELKGFFLQTGKEVLLANNIVVTPSGHLAYCCACVGDFGDFIRQPVKALQNMVTDPVASMLRRRETAIDLLTMAAEMDSAIKVLGQGTNPAVTGSTCYQLLSGLRLS